MNELPAYLRSFLVQKAYVFHEILQYNHRKSLYVLKIEQDGHYYLLKSYDKGYVNDDIIIKFKIEQDFYCKNKHITIPKLIYYEDNITILEYLEAYSLRDCLIWEDDKKRLIENLLSSIDTFQSILSRDDSEQDFSNVYRYISVLCHSHPIQGRDIKINFIDVVLNRIIYKVLLTKSQSVFDDFNDESFIKGFSHKDFHYNNILVTKDFKIKFIDFENIEYKGYFDFDVLFLLVLIQVYIDQHSDEYRILQNYLDNFFLRSKVLKEIYEIYTIAISTNKKFFLKSHKKSLSKIQKVILIIRFLIKGSGQNVQK